ncbi:MAG: DMT family protein [Verrucomicrobiota bacterium]
MISTGWIPIVMLFVSNLFMTVAWYGHLKHRDAPLARVILASWGIAFFEYVIMVPANRWGSAIYSPYQLKILQEVITLVVFSGFALLYFGTRPQWNHLAAFGCIIGAVVFTFLPGSSGRDRGRHQVRRFIPAAAARTAPSGGRAATGPCPPDPTPAPRRHGR